MKLGAVQSVQQAKPEGDAVTTPAAALQQDLAEAMPSAGPSETLQRVIAREAQERLGVGVDASEILGEQEAPQETVEDKLKLYQAPDLRVQVRAELYHLCQRPEPRPGWLRWRCHVWAPEVRHAPHR